MRRYNAASMPVTRGAAFGWQRSDCPRCHGKRRAHVQSIHASLPAWNAQLSVTSLLQSRDVDAHAIIG
jgi:hypothetical protein